MQYTLRRYLYYLRSIPTLLSGIVDWPATIAMFLGLPVPRPLTIRLRPTGLKLKVRTPMDVWIVKETCLDRDYEKFGVPVLDGWLVADIGAAIGDFAIDTAVRNPNSTVHAYEPFPESFELLQENIRLNNVENVTAFEEAVGSETGTVVLTLSGDPVQHGTAIQPTSEKTIVASAVTLQRVLERLGGRCNLLKMDCEGAEYSIFLETDPEVLENVQHIVMEYHNNVVGYSHRDLEAFLQKRGFAVSSNPSKVQPHLGFLFATNTRYNVHSQ